MSYTYNYKVVAYVLSTSYNVNRNMALDLHKPMLILFNTNRFKTATYSFKG